MGGNAAPPLPRSGAPAVRPVTRPAVGVLTKEAEVGPLEGAAARADEARRLRAIELKAKGLTQKEIAAALDVTPGAVSQWMRRYREGGVEGMRSRRDRSGARPRMEDGAWDRLAALLSEGPAAHGFDGAAWSFTNIARLIEREFGIRYHPAHVSRVLRGRNLLPLSM